MNETNMRIVAKLIGGFSPARKKALRPAQGTGEKMRIRARELEKVA